MNKRKVVIVGAASGMGEAIARRMAEHCELLLADINAGSLTALGNELGAKTALCNLLDVTTIESLAAAASDFDVLINTAGLSPTMSNGEKIFEVNYTGTVNLLSRFLPHARPSCVALCFASIAGHLFKPADAESIAVFDDPSETAVFSALKKYHPEINSPENAYGLSKFGVLRYCSKQAEHWGKVGARVLTLSPGLISTPMGDQELEGQPAMKDMLLATPLARLGTASEVAAVVEFLVSPAASFMSGSDVLVDGGVLSRFQ